MGVFVILNFALVRQGRSYVKYIFKKTEKKKRILPINLAHPNKLKNVYHKYLPHLTTAHEFLPSEFGFPGVSHYLGYSRQPIPRSYYWPLSFLRGPKGTGRT